MRFANRVQSGPAWSGRRSGKRSTGRKTAAQRPWLSACEKRRAAAQTSGANPDRQGEEGSFAVLALKLFWFFLDSQESGGAFFGGAGGVEGEEAGKDFVFEVGWPV